jgi:hypothetical protein
VAHRLGEVVQVDGGEAEEVVAAEPADRRHASFSPSLSLSLSLSARGGSERGRRGGVGRRSIRIRDSNSFSRRIAAGRCPVGFLEASVVKGEDGQAHVEFGWSK